jgi:hypothetical protein
LTQPKNQILNHVRYKDSQLLKQVLYAAN